MLGLTTLFLRPHRIPKLSAILKPATLFKLHKALVDRKYRLLFSSSAPRRKPGPKGPSPELIAAIVELKSRHAPPHLLSVGVRTCAGDARERPPVPILSADLEGCELAAADRNQRLPRLTPVSLGPLRRVYVKEPHVHATVTH